MSGPTETLACAVCGRILDYISGKGWAHSYQDLVNADHIAVPVSLEQIAFIGRCDFCNVDFPAWELPARDFRTPIGTMSSGAWAACNACADLISKNKWQALLQRVVPIAARRNNMPPDLIKVTLIPLYARLRLNITGPLQRPDRKEEQ